MLSNEKKCAFRRCGAEGTWLGRHINDSKGWTNYTPCFPPLVQKILGKVNEDEAEAQLKFETAVNTRTIEMVGIIASFITIVIAIVIFNAFSSLHNRRTVIHKHLFYALLMEVFVRLVLYTRQSYSVDGEELEDGRRGIEYFPYVCEGAYVLLEYSRLVVYAWMFIEGIFLNTLISANSLRNEIPIMYFYVGGWGAPALLIAVWATVVGRHYSTEPLYTCWYGYNYLPSYYIIQGPILAIVGINMLFLGTIMSVIIMKLRRTHDSELKKIQCFLCNRKTIRATVILLPLLGIINIFNLFDYPLNGSSTGFAVWAYFTHFFRSFQGVFISFIYCFSNGEVRKAIKKRFERRTWCRFECLERRRKPQPRQREPPIFAIAENENMELVPIPTVTWARNSSTNMISEMEAGPSQSEAMSNYDNENGPPPRDRRPSATYMTLNFGNDSNTSDLRTLSVHMPADERPLSRIQISIERRPSNEMTPGHLQHHRVPEGSVRRPSQEMPSAPPPPMPHQSQEYNPEDYASGVMTVHAPPIPHRERVFRPPMHSSDAMSIYAAPVHNVRRFSADNRIANPECPVHYASGRTSSGIPSITPMELEDSSLVSSLESSCCVCCTCGYERPRRSSVPDKPKPQKDTRARYPNTKFQPNRISRSSSEVRVPRERAVQPVRADQPNVHVIDPARRGATVPRPARRQPFVRPGLVTKDSHGRSYSNCV